MKKLCLIMAGLALILPLSLQRGSAAGDPALSAFVMPNVSFERMPKPSLRCQQIAGFTFYKGERFGFSVDLYESEGGKPGPEPVAGTGSSDEGFSFRLLDKDKEYFVYAFGFDGDDGTPLWALAGPMKPFAYPSAERIRLDLVKQGAPRKRPRRARNP